MTNMAVSRIGQPYSPEEIEILERLVTRRLRSAEIREAFPGRTPGAVRFALNGVRKRIGIALQRPSTDGGAEIAPTVLKPDDPGLPCEWPRQQAKTMAESNARFIAALAAA